MSERFAATRCSMVQEFHYPLLAAVTGLTERVVKNRLAKAEGNTTVADALRADWPISADRLGPISVVLAREANLELEIAQASGLGPRAVKNRLERTHGRTLLKNAFPEFSEERVSVGALGPDDDEVEEAEEDTEDEDEVVESESQPASASPSPASDAKYMNGVQRFSPLELLGATRADSINGSSAFVTWLAAELTLSVPVATMMLNAVPGSTSLRKVFQTQWPKEGLEILSGEALGGLSAAPVRRSPSLVRLLADTVNRTPNAALKELAAANDRTPVSLVFPSLTRPPKRDLPVAGKGRRGPKPTASPPPSTSSTPPTPAPLPPTSLPSGAVSEPPPVPLPSPPLPPPPPPLPPPLSPPGEPLLAGRYRMGRLLGAGGFGKVFEAKEVDGPQQRVVVKLGISDDPEALWKEIGVAFELGHQNICQYKSRGQDPHYGTYLILQYGGRSLERVIEEQGPIPAERAIFVIQEAAAGLDYAHKRGVIHQDVKPGNILVGDDDKDWQVRVTDFGISVQGVYQTNTVGKGTVVATRIKGYTPSYAAPEQLRESIARKGSDQYSLALVFCSMLLGEILTGHYKKRKFASLSESQNRALSKALDDDPDERFDTCSEFATALRVDK